MNTPVVSTNQHPFIDIANSRTEDQKAIMESIDQAGHCPFCPENLKKYHQQPILKTGKYWLVTANQWPYQHTKYHFLIILHRHIETLSQLTAAEATELIALAQFLEKKYQIKGGALAVRFGDTRHSAGTVKHLHAQLVVPDITHPEFETVKISVGKKP